MNDFNGASTYHEWATQSSQLQPRTVQASGHPTIDEAEFWRQERIRTWRQFTALNPDAVRSALVASSAPGARVALRTLLRRQVDEVKEIQRRERVSRLVGEWLANRPTQPAKVSATPDAEDHSYVPAVGWGQWSQANGLA